MPVTIVFGGQFGSEGKGKVAHVLAKTPEVAAVVRVGGPNSGHTPCAPPGRHAPFQQLPTAALLDGVVSVLGPGSYIDTALLREEISRAGLERNRVAVDPAAVVISPDDRVRERNLELETAIGSTLSGTGSAVARRVLRDPSLRFASDEKTLAPYVRPTGPYLRSLLDDGRRVIVEGTQGHGLSILHAPMYPFATSRDTTAAGLLAEAGLSPVDVDDVVMVLRAFPIRVAGHSGPLPLETTWQQVTIDGVHDHELVEYTTVTKRMRRVAYFDAGLVRDAIKTNQPTRIAINHLDYLDHGVCQSREPTDLVRLFVRDVERAIDRHADLVGWGADILNPRDSIELSNRRSVSERRSA